MCPAFSCVRLTLRLRFNIRLNPFRLTAYEALDFGGYKCDGKGTHSLIRMQMHPAVAGDLAGVLLLEYRAKRFEGGTPPKY